MKKIILIVTAASMVYHGGLYQSYGQSAQDIRSYCPHSGEVASWFSEDEPRIAPGEDLFLMINGGADIYFEYGFRDAAFLSLKTKNGNAINLEIYRMNSPESAYGIYTFKTGLKGRPVDSGNDGWMEEYYLNFWKSDILVTLIGLDMEKETLKGLVELAAAIDAKIYMSAERPEVIDILPETGLKPNGITFMKGNLALFNQYAFDSRDIFKFNVGIRGEYDDYDLFLLFYDNPEESLMRFNSATEMLISNGLFNNHHKESILLTMKDKDGQQVAIKQSGHCIIIFKGHPEVDYLPVFEGLEKQIPH